LAGSVEGRIIIAGLGAVTILALAVEVALRPVPPFELRLDVALSGPSGAPLSSAPSPPEPELPAAPTSSAASTSPAARAASTPGKPLTGARPKPSSDVRDPWSK